MLSPKLVCLDSSTWGRLAKDRESNPDAKKVVELLNLGALVPYFTWHHVEEICQHGNDAIFERRISLIDSLRFVAFPKLSGKVANIGNLIDLRRLEVMELIRNAALTLQELIDLVRPQITNGFCTGRELCSTNRLWWDIYRRHCSTDRQAHKTRLASLVQFPMGDQKERVSESLKNSRLRGEADARVQFAAMTQALAERLKKDGDPRLRDPDKTASEFMREAYEGGRSLYEMDGNAFERLLRLNNVDHDRLSANATMRDVGYESHFCKLLALHEEWLDLPLGTLGSAIRQEMVPSWVVWREVDRAMKSSAKANASNVNDLSMIGFALYVDALECDKRVREFVRQGVTRHPLLAVVEKRLVKWKNYADLRRQLERIAPM
jgi:hypothetical protein